MTEEALQQSPHRDPGSAGEDARGEIDTVVLQHFPSSARSVKMLSRLRDHLAQRRPEPGSSLVERRVAFEAAAADAEIDSDVEVIGVSVGGLHSRWVIPRAVAPIATILYLHGGGYVVGSSRSHLALTARIAKASRAAVLSVDYRLAPENPFPAALDDATRVCELLTSRSEITSGPGELRMSGQPIFLGGDSAGASLALTAALRAMGSGDQQPIRGVFCLSPWADLTMTASSLSTNADLDGQVPVWLLREMAAMYVGPTHDPADGEVSPVFADLRGLPTLLVQASSAEVLYDDSHALVHAARLAGVDVTYQVWTDMPHVWHAYAPRLSEALDAIHRIGEWVQALSSPHVQPSMDPRCASYIPHASASAPLPDIGTD